MRIYVFIVAVLAAVFFSQAPVNADWFEPDTDKVPIERLVSNLQAFATTLPPHQNIDRARVEFQIGRLYSMAYARKTADAEVRKQQVWEPKPHLLETQLMARVAQIWQKQKGGQGRGIVIDVQLSLDKKLKSIKIHQSSGDDALDRAALAAMRRAVTEEHIVDVQSSGKDDPSGPTYRIEFDDCAVGGKSAVAIPAELKPNNFRHLDSPLEVEQTTEEARLQAAKTNLALAIAHLQKAIEFNPNLLAARLGLAWCLDQSGKKSEAITLYREVFKSSYEKEVRSVIECFPELLTGETGGYLLKLLNPETDAAEIADIQAKMKRIEARIPSCITPLLVPLTSASKLDALIEARRVQFDLDGRGPRTCLSWITPRAGWLVFDKTKSGTINSGKQLIGGVTFWVFWKNGYEVLVALDDSHDGKLSGAELDRLAVWSDANGDGISQPGEVKPLSYWHIKELSCTMTEENGHWLSHQGITFEDGTHRPSYDVWIQQEPRN
jgi:TonB family protein